MLELILGRAAISVFRQGFIDMDGRDKPAERMKTQFGPALR
ncbi:hypothetical protein [Afipia clevelandensis]|nr:hypothetical protein [Afipia clevelandensis]